MSRASVRVGALFFVAVAACGGSGSSPPALPVPEVTTSDVASFDPAGLGYLVRRTVTVPQDAGVVEVTASCPVGAVALGVGWAALSSDGILEDGAPLLEVPGGDGRSWSVRVVATQELAWKLEVDIACVSAASVPSRQVITRPDAALSTAATQTATLSCPDASKPVGAGWEALDARGRVLEATLRQHAPSGSGWTTAVEVGGGVAWRLRTYVVCVDPADLSGYELISGQGDATHQVQTTCPETERPAGAGWAFVDTVGSVTLDDLQPWSRGWITGGRAPSAGTLTQTQICIR